MISAGLIPWSRENSPAWTSGRASEGDQSAKDQFGDEYTAQHQEHQKHARDRKAQHRQEAGHPFDFIHERSNWIELVLLNTPPKGFANSSIVSQHGLAINNIFNCLHG
jgi:hypothetical protein